MNAAPCELCGRVNPVVAPIRRERMHLLARMMRALLLPLGWRVHALTGVFCALALWSMRVRWVTPFLEWEEVGLLISGLLLGVIWGGRLMLRGAVWGFAPATRANKRTGARSFLVLPVCLALLWGLDRLDVPLRAGFWLSRESLDTWANSTNFALLRRTGSLGQVGVYWFVLQDVRGKNVRFESANNSFIGSGTQAGFARCPRGCGVAGFPSVWTVGSSPPTYRHLADDWYWWEQAGTDF